MQRNLSELTARVLVLAKGYFHFVATTFFYTYLLFVKFENKTNLKGEKSRSKVQLQISFVWGTRISNS